MEMAQVMQHTLDERAAQVTQEERAKEKKEKRAKEESERTSGGSAAWSKWPSWRGDSWPPRAHQAASEGLSLLY